MKKRNILHIISKFNGDHPLFDDFILKLDSSLYRSVVCFVRGRPEKQSRLEREGVKTIYLEGGSGKIRGLSLKKLFQIKEILQEEKIDLMHCQRHKPMVYSVLASLLTESRPICYTVHGAKRTRSVRRRFFNRLLLKRVDRVLAVSKAVRKDILDTNPYLDPEKVLAVQNGLDYSKLLRTVSIPRNEIRTRILKGHEKKLWYGTMGRLKPVKNQTCLIRAFAGLLRQVPNSILLIAGEGPLEEELKELVKAFHLEEKIFLLGYREDAPEYLHALDFFVFPSLSEGLGLAMLEAMASSLPVIVSDIDASREIMGDIQCGFLVNPLDEEDICRGMVQMSKLDHETHLLMGQRARQRALDSFSIDRMIKEIAGIYDDLLR